MTSYHVTIIVSCDSHPSQLLKHMADAMEMEKEKNNKTWLESDETKRELYFSVVENTMNTFEDIHSHKSKSHPAEGIFFTYFAYEPKINVCLIIFPISKSKVMPPLSNCLH